MLGPPHILTLVSPDAGLLLGVNMENSGVGMEFSGVGMENSGVGMENSGVGMEISGESGAQQCELMLSMCMIVSRP